MAHDRDDDRDTALPERTDALARRPLAMLTLGELLQAMRELMREELARAHGPQTTALPQLEPPPEYLTVQEVARLCSVSEKTIRAWVQEKKLPARKMGKLLRIDRRDLEQALPRTDGPRAVNRLDVDGLASNILSRRRGK